MKYGRQKKFRVTRKTARGSITVLATADTAAEAWDKADAKGAPFRIEQLELGEDLDEYFGRTPKRPRWVKVYEKEAPPRKGRLPNGARPFIPNPSAPPAVTDRALRYRAHRNPPDGPQVCHYCGADPGRLDLEHIDGREENSDPSNLAWACRSCNTTKGAHFAEEGIGRLTRQYNPRGKPARSVDEYARAVGALMGANRRQAPGRAIATVQATRPGDRASFARQLRRLVNPSIPTFEQYAFAVTGRNHSGIHDERGAIIHATPPATRREYARRLASQRRARRDEVPF